MPPVNFGSYQTKIYYEGTTLNKVPAITTNPTLLEKHAQKVLSSRAYSYVAGGAGEKSTMEANRLAFRQWKLVPRVMRPMDDQSISVNLFGQEYKTPLIVGPVGVQALFHNDKETGVAQVCAELEVPYTLSTASSSSIEDVAAANQAGHRWFQLYWVHDEEILLSLLKRAKENGFTVLVVSLDTWTLGWRPTDLDQGYFPFYTGIGNEVGFTDPVFRAKHEKNGGNMEDIIGAAKAWVAELDDRPHTWEQVDFLRKHWEGPIVLKGIQHVDDARRALETGCEGLVVSNHGGRQVDGAIGSLDALPPIVDAVGHKMTVMFDSGVRTGSDAIKALCLGAKAVLIGRPVIYGLALGGKEGAKSVVESLLADLWQGMGLAGMRTVADCNRDCMRKINYSGEGPNML